MRKLAYRLSFVLVLALLLPALALPAYADCGAGTPGDDLINCDDDPDGVNALTGSDTVNVLPGAAVGGTIGTLDGGDRITNDGTISVNGSPTSGVGTLGDNTTVTNNGTINAQGNPAFGVVTMGNNNTVTNNGVINVPASDGVGVWSVGNNNTVTNNGAVSATGSDAEGIYTQGNNTVVNNGNITTTGFDAEGIAAYDGHNTVVNNGAINTSSADAQGIDTSQGGGDDTVINNGSINAANAEAITTGAGNDTVILGGGPVNGLIDGGADIDTLGFNLEVGAEGLEAVAAQIAAANPNGGTIRINGHTYTWANFEQLLSLLRLAAFQDGRLNALDFAATVALYCVPGGGVSLYAINGQGQGEWAFLASADAIQAALAAATSGGTQMPVGEGLGVSLWALYPNQLQAMGADGYLFTFSPAACDLGD